MNESTLSSTELQAKIDAHEARARWYGARAAVQTDARLRHHYAYFNDRHLAEAARLRQVLAARVKVS